MRTLLVVAALVASSEAFGGGAKDAPKKAAAKKASPQKKAAPKKVAPKKWGRGWGGGWVVLAEQNGSVSSSLYDGREGRPAAHLVIAWPHGVPVVDGMVDTFNADGNMSVVSLANAVMHNATELGACIYATEKSMLQEREKAAQEGGHRGIWMQAYNQRHIQHKTEFLGRINSKAVVVMVVVDTKPVILPNLHNGHMDGVKRQLRKAYNPPVVGRAGHHHALHVTDDPSEIALMLRCLGMPPPQPSAILASALAARVALRSYQPRPYDGTPSGGGARGGGAVERAFWTGLAALSSQGCMRGVMGRASYENHGPCVDDAYHDCVLRAVSSAVVLKGGDRAVWPVGAKQSTDVDILVSNTTDAISCLASRFKHTRVTGLPAAQLHFDVMISPQLDRSIHARSDIMVRFNLYGELHSSPTTMDPTWAEGVRRRSVWVLSPAGFAYRRQSPADECAMRRDADDSRLWVCG